jgi:hypothetical protein
VAAYALLLLAAHKTYGADGKPEMFKPPRWDKRNAPFRRGSYNLLSAEELCPPFGRSCYALPQ